MVTFNYQSEEHLLQALQALRQEVAALKTEKAAFEAQKQLLEHLVAMARCSSCEEMLKTTLQETLDVSCKLCGAEKGSLFLLDGKGEVTAYILTRREAAQEVATSLLHGVLQEGLAGWVYRNRQIGLITDTENDERWVTLPDQPYTVRSALAVPIIRNEELVGIITLLHQNPNRFCTQTAALMEMAGEQIALILENAQLYEKLQKSYSSLDKAKQVIETYSKALDTELEKGWQIQRDFLPREILQLPNWEIATSFHPARQVSGDFYDVFKLSDDYVGLVIADVCDKGVGAALFMALFRSLIRVFSGSTRLHGLSIIGNDEGLGYLIDSKATIDFNQINALKAVVLTNNYIAQEHNSMMMFATLFFGVLNSATGCLSYINGGHEPLYVIGDSGVKKSLKRTGPPLGVMANAKFEIQQVHLDPGDILLGYTDGVTEARSPKREFFTNKRLLSILQDSAPSASQLLQHIKSNLDAHIDNEPQFDDITMLAVRRNFIT